MLLLISPINREEALESIKGGADIVDVKNPKEGSLGANFPWVIKEIRELTPEDKLVSATLGDVPYKPGTVSLAAMGAHVSGADYIKVGLYGTKTHDEAVEVMENVVKTVKEISEETIMVIRKFFRLVYSHLKLGLLHLADIAINLIIFISA